MTTGFHQTAGEFTVQAESVDGVPVKPVEMAYMCNECDSSSDVFRNRCPKCGNYNTLCEVPKDSIPKPVRLVIPFWELREERMKETSGLSQAAAPSIKLPEVPVGAGKLYSLDEALSLDSGGRILTGEEQLDFVLGGGMNMPSVIMMGGDPGVGKSTLLTQVFGHIGHTMMSYYAAGEEAVASIGGRMKRVANITEANRANCKLRRGSDFGVVMSDLRELKPKFVVFDSLQAHLHPDVDPTGKIKKLGCAAQVVPMANELHKWAHDENAIVVIVCHVTKDGDFAGPNTVDHAVDVNLKLTRLDDGTVAATSEKNRFGDVEVAGIFRHAQNGLRSVE